MGEWIRTKTVIARKVHACDWCDEVVKVGEKAKCTTSQADGSVYDLYMHIECDKAYSRDLSEGNIEYYSDRPYEKHEQIRGKTISETEESKNK